jgi:hypothetical protein
MFPASLGGVQDPENQGKLKINSCDMDSDPKPRPKLGMNPFL